MPDRETLARLQDLATQELSTVEGVTEVSVTEIVQITTVADQLTPEAEGGAFERQQLIVAQFPGLAFDFRIIRKNPTKGQAQASEVRFLTRGIGSQ